MMRKNHYGWILIILENKIRDQKELNELGKRLSGIPYVSKVNVADVNETSLYDFVAEINDPTMDKLKNIQQEMLEMDEVKMIDPLLEEYCSII